VTLILSIVE